MTEMQKRIYKRLEPAEKEPVRRVMVSLPLQTIADAKRIARTLRQVSGEHITQAMIFNDAIDEFLSDCLANPEIQKMLSVTGYEQVFRILASAKGGVHNRVK